MKSKSQIRNIGISYRNEEKELKEKGLDSWEAITKLDDKEISNMAKAGLSTPRNLKRLRCVAILMNELNLVQSEASLLIHSGIASVEALSNLTPQELTTKTGRLERILNTSRNPLVDLQKANDWIKRAKKRIKEN